MTDKITRRQPEIIRCRAKVAKGCLHGRPYTDDSGDPDQDCLWHDGTWIEATDSIVCTPCYIKLGTPPNPVLPHAVP